jgi:hypothetical protein
VDQWVQERERAHGSEQVVVESKSNRGWVIWCRTVVEGSQAKTNRAKGRWARPAGQPTQPVVQPATSQQPVMRGLGCVVEQQGPTQEQPSQRSGEP